MTGRPTLERTDAVAEAALRKATWRIIPLLALGYAIAYMDRVNISFASLQMNRDLHFSSTVYGFGAGLFFLSYSACEVPSNLLLYRFGARRWLARIMMTWGVIAVAMIFVRTPLEFYAVRFLLGMAEAGFFPGVIFYLMQWFPAGIRARTVTRFYVSSPLSSVLMGLIAGALLNLQGRLGLAGWQWLILVEALPAVVLGVVFFYCLADSPATARWLSEPERQSILTVVKAGSPAPHGGDDAIGPALRSTQVWLLGLFMFGMLGSMYAYTFSAPAIIQGLTGLSTTDVGFIVAGAGVAGAAAMIGNAILADRTGKPFACILPVCLLWAATFVVSGVFRSPAIALPAILLAPIACYAIQGPLWVIAGAFLTGRQAAAGIAAMNTIGILGGFAGPYWMGFARDLTGNYQRGLLTLAPVMLIASAIMFYLGREAQRRPHAAAAPATDRALDAPTL